MMKAVFDFFKTEGYSLAMFRADWARLTDTDKDQLRTGVENGTLTY